MKFFKAYIDTSLIELDYQKAGELMQGFITDSGTVESQIIFYFICHFWYKFLLFLV